MRVFILSVASFICLQISQAALSANGSTTVLRSEQIQSILNQYLESNAGQEETTSTRVSSAVERHIDQLIRQTSNDDLPPGAIAEPQLLTVSVEDFVGLLNRKKTPAEAYESEDNVEYRQLVEDGKVSLDAATHLLTIKVSDRASLHIQPSVPLSISPSIVDPDACGARQ